MGNVSLPAIYATVDQIKHNPDMKMCKCEAKAELLTISLHHGNTQEERTTPLV
jgi:hypothetical protein